MSRTGSWLAPFALFWRAFGQIVIVSFVPLQLVSTGDHHYLALGFIYGLPFFMQLLFAPLWGRLLDRMRRPGVLAAIGFVGYAAMEAGTAVSGSQSGIFLSLALGGVLGAALSPAAKWQALRARDGHRTLALALRAEAAGWLAGALLPAVFSAMGRDVFQLLGVTAVCTVLSAPIFWPVADTAPAEPELPPGDAAARRLPLGFWLFFLGAFLQFLIGETFYAFYGVYLTRYLGGPLWLYSGSIAVTTVLGLLLYGFAARTTHRVGAGPVLIATSLVYLVSYGLLALFPSVPMAAITFSIPAFSFFRTAATIGIAHAAPNRSGSAMGMLDAAEGLASSIGGPVSGFFVATSSLGVLPLLPLMLSAVASVPLLLARRARAALPSAGVGEPL
ncbi:MAG: MFS transporter [Thermaerobacter sp.]|nr:MFS transporter [Thermaerobacter sp.]